MPWVRYWWRTPGLLFTAVVDILYGLALNFAGFEPVWLAWSIIAGVAMVLFAVQPWDRVWYRTAGLAGFTFWSFQCCRLLIQIVEGGLTEQDWRPAAGVLAYGYLAVVFGTVWVTSVKDWHLYKLGRQEADKD